MSLVRDIVILAQLCLLAQTCSGTFSLLKFGSCDSVPSMEKFDVTKFSGVWYTLLWVPNKYVEGRSCLLTNYTLSGQQIMAETYGLDSSGAPVMLPNTLDLHTGPPFYMKSQAKGSKPSVKLTIYDTDYTEYSCMHMCMKQWAFKVEFVWVRSRYPSLRTSYADRCKTALRRHTEDFDWDRLVTVQHGKTCPYWSKLQHGGGKLQYREPDEVYSELLSDMGKAVQEAIAKDIEDTDVLLDVLESQQRDSAGPVLLNAGPVLARYSTILVLLYWILV